MDNTHIEWADHTWNPWKGCQKVSEGCKFCYAARDFDRFNLGRFENVTATKMMQAPIKLNRKANGERQRVFTCSWSDFFVQDADPFREAAWGVIRDCPDLDFLILTKRTERIQECLPSDWGNGYSNVWLGVSAENDRRFEERVEILCDIPATIRFVSAEPLIGPIQNAGYYPIDWMIVGGESGNFTGKWSYRECRKFWMDSIVGQCVDKGIPVFVKQLGTSLARELGLKDRHGRDIEEFPDSLKYRYFPAVEGR